jgi:polar amino acid transport system substrate-binding protein
MQKGFRSARQSVAAFLAAVAGCAALAIAGDPPRVEPVRPAPQRAEPLRKLRVAAMPIASAVEWSGERPTGAVVDIWDDLAGRLGVATEYVRCTTFTKLMDAAKNGETDVALGPLAITEARERAIDLTHPIFHSGLRIAVRQRTNTGFLSALESLASWELMQMLGGVLALAITSGHLLWWFERRANPDSFPRDYFRGVREATWWIASAIVTGGCDDKHVDSLLGRAIAFAWMIGGIVLIAAFTSVLTATMTAERVTGTIHGPRDLAGRTVGCQEGAVTVQSVRQRGGIPQEFAMMTDALDALDLGMVEAVVAENQQLMFLVNQPNRRATRIVGAIFDSFDYGLGLPSGSPLREDLNSAILQMREDGTLERIKELWLGRHD